MMITFIIIIINQNSYSKFGFNLMDIKNKLLKFTIYENKIISNMYKFKNLSI